MHVFFFLPLPPILGLVVFGLGEIGGGCGKIFGIDWSNLDLWGERLGFAPWCGAIW